MRLLARSHVAGRTKPLFDVTLAVKHGYGAGERPPDRAIDAHDPVFQLKNAFGPDGRLNNLQHVRLVFQGDVLDQPGATGLVRVGNKLAALQMAHLGPISAHAVHNVRAGTDQCPELFFAGVNRRAGLPRHSRHLQMSRDASQQFFGTERLDHVVSCPFLHAFYPALFPGTGRQHDDRDASGTRVGAYRLEQP